MNSISAFLQQFKRVNGFFILCVCLSVCLSVIVCVCVRLYECFKGYKKKTGFGPVS